MPDGILAVDPQFTLKPDFGAFEVVSTYIFLRIEHIFAGFGHLLFVLAPVIIVRSVRRLR